MKSYLNILAMILLLLITGNQLYANSPIAVESKIEAVKVYRTGAVIERTTTVNLPVGVSEIHFTALSPHLDPNSIMLNTTSGVTILSVSAGREFMTEIPESPELKKLRESIDALALELQYDRANIEVLAEEESLLIGNKSIGGQHTGITADQLQSVSNFFRTRLGEIKTKRVTLQHAMVEKNKELTRMRNQINEIQQRQRPANSFTVVIRAMKSVPGNVSFKLSYLTGNSSWVSTFDFRVQDINSPLIIDYKGDVRNGSGEDWDNVKLSLNTGDPSRNNIIPILTPWRIGYFTPTARGRAQLDEMVMESQMGNIRSAQAKEDFEFAPPPTIAQSAENIAGTEFTINDLFTIPADGKSYTLLLETTTKDVSYFYTIVPKRSTSAYLTATLKEYEGLNLTLGEASIYYGSTYIGKTHINPFTAADSLNISLGIDIGVAVTREKLQDKSTRRFLSNRNEEIHAWSIKVRNNKSTAALFKIYDQVPLPRLDEIEVRHEIENNGSFDEDSGIISWNVTLQSGESKEFRFNYTVRYPRNQVIGW